MKPRENITFRSLQLGGKQPQSKHGKQSLTEGGIDITVDFPLIK